MKVIVKTAFPGRPDNEAVSRTIAVGEEIAGDLAAVAVKEGWAEELPEESPATEDDASQGDGEPSPVKASRKKKAPAE